MSGYELRGVAVRALAMLTGLWSSVGQGGGQAGGLVVVRSDWVGRGGEGGYKSCCTASRNCAFLLACPAPSHRAARNIQTRPPPPSLCVFFMLTVSFRTICKNVVAYPVPQCRSTTSEEVMQGDWMSSVLVTPNRCALRTLGVS